MSDAAITTIMAGIVTVVTLITGVVSLWLKQHRMAVQLEDNMVLTRETKEAATAASALAEEMARDNSETVHQIEKQTNSIVDALKDQLKYLQGENTRLVASVKELTK